VRTSPRGDRPSPPRNWRRWGSRSRSLSAARKATILQRVYGEILDEGHPRRIATWEERNEVTGLAADEALEERDARGERES
jgi:hypothetical protein